MKRIILCEGKTDAILISYFLKKVYGWSYTKDMVIRLPVKRDNEVLNWYSHPEKPGQELVIWGVGGIEQLPVKVGHVINFTQRVRTPTDRFERIVLFFDRDQREEEECVQLIEDWTKSNDLKLIDDLQLGQWVDVITKLLKKPPERHKLSILSIVLPPDGKGALETFLTDSIRSCSDEDRQLVDEAREFIERLPSEPYLNKRRFRPKACLGAILSVMSPDWVFSEVDERLIRVQWEDIESVLDVYKKLEEL